MGYHSRKAIKMKKYAMKTWHNIFMLCRRSKNEIKIIFVD